MPPQRLRRRQYRRFPSSVHACRPSQPRDSGLKSSSHRGVFAVQVVESSPCCKPMPGCQVPRGQGLHAEPRGKPGLAALLTCSPMPHHLQWYALCPFAHEQTSSCFHTVFPVLTRAMQQTAPQHLPCCCCRTNDRCACCCLVLAHHRLLACHVRSPNPSRHHPARPHLPLRRRLRRAKGWGPSALLALPTAAHPMSAHQLSSVPKPFTSQSPFSHVAPSPACACVSRGNFPAVHICSKFNTMTGDS